MTEPPSPLTMLLSRHTRRREFITLLGGAAAAWPLAARAQQPSRVRRIGVLVNLAADDSETQARVGAFLQGLQGFGWRSGAMRVRIPLGGRCRAHPQIRREITALAPDVILTTGNPTGLALQQVTRTLPIVFVAFTDPVAGGLVDSLARPGGNATGFTSFEFGMSAKWLELLKEIMPGSLGSSPPGPRQSGRHTTVRRFPAEAPRFESTEIARTSRRRRNREEHRDVRTPFDGGLIVTRTSGAIAQRELIIKRAARTGCRQCIVSLWSSPGEG